MKTAKTDREQTLIGAANYWQALLLDQGVRGEALKAAVIEEYGLTEQEFSKVLDIIAAW